jgi:2'-hydroxyisoflavone reductase
MSQKNTNHKDRRKFLRTSLKMGAMLPFLGPSLPKLSDKEKDPIKPAPHPLNILILGGTSFLGPHQIAYALNRGHSISIFTRGKTQPTIYKKLFKKVEHLVGDRANDLEALKGRKWDAVVDNSGHRVQWTKDSAELLKDNVPLYLYTSSTGVYYPYLGSNIKEDTKPVLEVPEGINEEQSIEYNYGVMKAKSEIEAKKIYGDDRCIIVRPTYMMGPADRTDRFTYWPVRLSRGGEVLVPGKPDDPVQYIDVRDVAEWMIRLIENENSGTFNAVGPASPTGMHAFVYGAHAAFSSKASFVMVDDYDFLMKHQIPYSIPWIMPTGDNYGSARVNNDHGVANGLTFRPLAKSVMDIHEWWHSDAVTEERQKTMVEKGLMAREQEIIVAWRASKK